MSSDSEHAYIDGTLTGREGSHSHHPFATDHHHMTSTTGGSAALLGTPDDEGNHEHSKNHHHTSTHHHHHKYSITHPGYFPPSTTGPIYTPAPPEALAELKAKQRNVITLLQQLLGAAGALIQRSLVVGNIDLHRGTLYGHIHGEDLPRVFENVSANVSLGSGYDTLNIEIDASPRERDVLSQKCTMLHPHAHRHLRDYTGLTALRALAAAEGGSGDGRGDVGAHHTEDVSEDSSASSSSSSSSSQGSGGVRGRTSTTTTTNTKQNSGGHVRVTVNAAGLADNDLAIGGPRFPEMTIAVHGKNLHAPLVERIFELPMDIDAGRANGEFIIKMHDVTTWQTPEYYGRVAVRGAAFHFWDATDDILDADLDLLFEGDRLYLHRAKGRFGDVSMSLTGDLDLNPLHGEYRLSATVPGVEINALRATLGVRPTPFPVVGSVAGTLHVTGPLEKPVFSGIARVARPSPTVLADCEPTNALDTLLAEPEAVGAYDKIPIASAELVFSLNTATETMTLHEFRACPLGGGELHGSGTLGVSPASETDPSALSITAQGSGLPAEALASRYLPEGAQVPPGVIPSGPASVTATMRGAHLAPVIDVALSMPESSVSGTVRFTRDATSLSIVSPNLEGSGTIFLNPPSYEAIKAAVTQEQATALAKPDISGCDTDMTLRGLDMLPLVSDEASRRRLAQQSGEPVRLRVNGRAKVSGTVTRNSSTTPSVHDDTTPTNDWQFGGVMDLEDVKLNQLKLYRGLKGTLKLSTSRVAVHARGMRPDEGLDVELSLPLFPESSGGEEEGEQGKAEDNAGGTMVEEIDKQQYMQPTSSSSNSMGSSVSVRCGQLSAAATVDADGSQLDMRVTNVKLDELELASLRGELQEISCSLNFQSQTGRGRVNLTAPRYSGLRGDSLSGGFRWERDVLRLEKLVLQQRRSKYEVQGEYVVPPTTSLPTSAADLARRNVSNIEDTPALPVPGRWRLRVDVPAADMQEILPAARLLQSAATRHPADYERAKTAFISAVREVSLKAEGLNAQLRSLAEKLSTEFLNNDDFNVPPSSSSSSSQKAGAAPSAPTPTSSSTFQLPALQDVHGHWNGSVQAFGGGGGATSCEFDIRGTDWQWGQAKLDMVVADGSYHSEEGLQLQEFVLKSGDAKLLVRGSLLSDHQDATFLLTDFPMTRLRPIFRAIPALKNAAPAVSANVPKPVASPLPLGLLANVLNNASQGLSSNYGPDADSPINGMLYISGALSGSKEAPQGEVAVRLFDAAVGATRLAQAQASARLSENRQLTFNVDIVPVEGHRKSGHIRAAGSIPLQQAQSQGEGTGEGAGALGGASLPSATTSTSGSATITTTPPLIDSLSASGAPSNNAFSVQQQQQQPPAPLDVRVSVRDSGMAVLTSIAPEITWQSGEADLSFRFTGTLEQPTVNGAAIINKAIIDCPVLKYPLEVLAADITCDEGMLEVETFDARVGRKGHIKARGALPVYQTKQPPRGLPLCWQQCSID